MRHSTGKPTKAEQARISRMMDLGCLPCASLGMFSLPRSKLECHHILSGGRRISHWYTLCLCKGHHQGIWTAEQRDQFKESFRVAISDGRKAFRAVYGSEFDLWLKTQHLLGLDDSLPKSKRVPREGVRHDAQVNPELVAMAQHSEDLLHLRRSDSRDDKGDRPALDGAGGPR